MAPETMCAPAELQTASVPNLEAVSLVTHSIVGDMLHAQLLPCHMFLHILHGSYNCCMFVHMLVKSATHGGQSCL